jgi:two-component system OmpR family sensor kinase
MAWSNADPIRSAGLPRGAGGEPPTGTAVRVTLFAPAKDGVVSLVVADEGAGIDPGLRPHLFERFSQGDPVRRQGSGLGLSIARAIAEAHHGTIELRSPAQGTGSEFVVTLPSMG